MFGAQKEKGSVSFNQLLAGLKLLKVPDVTREKVAEQFGLAEDQRWSLVQFANTLVFPQGNLMKSMQQSLKRLRMNFVAFACAVRALAASRCSTLLPTESG